MANIAILGYGTVGSGVYEVIKTNQQVVDNKSGQAINIKYVLDLRDFPGDPVESVLTHNFDDVVNDDSVEVVVEVMGGLEPAYTFVKKCLLAGKSVCTSNKELVAKKGPELLQIARDKNVNFLFEASVGGGIPIIRPLNTSLTADVITEITGILNGTTNYILTQMGDKGWDFEDALKKAQELGYAERNPEADIEGFDACRKIAILSSLALGSYVDFEDIYTEGISKITSRDIEYAKKLGRAIKLLASAKIEGDKVYAMVAPFMIPDSHPLFSVSGVFNAIFVNGNCLGDVMFYGSGAGKLPTASAVVSDVVDAVRHLGENMQVFWNDEKVSLTSTEDATRAFFVRIKGNCQERIDEIKSILGDGEAVALNMSTDEFGFVTRPMKEQDFMAGFNNISDSVSFIRLEK